MTSRILYTANGARTFQLGRIILGGDIQQGQHELVRQSILYSCNERGKTIRSNQNALLCTECNGRSHAKCLGLNKIGFKYYKDYQDRMWTCGLCSLLFRSESCLSNETCELENTMTMTNTQTRMEGIEEI